MRTANPDIPPRRRAPPAWLPARPPPRHPAAGTLGFPLVRTEKIRFRLPSFPPAKSALSARSIALAELRKCLPPGSRAMPEAKYPLFPRAILPLERALRSSIPPHRCRLASSASETMLHAAAGSLPQCRHALYAPLLRLLLCAAHLPPLGDSVAAHLALALGANPDSTKLRFAALL